MSERSVPSSRREKEAYKAMNTQQGTIWANAGNVTRYNTPHADNSIIDSINAGQSVTILCYSHGDTQSFKAPDGVTYTSDAWDFVVTSDQDAGGFVNDVHINTGGDIRKQL